MRQEDCWYLDVCSNECGGCARYLEMKYLITHSGLPENLQKVPGKLDAPSCDYDAYVRLNDIKGNIKDFVDNGKNLLIVSNTTGNGKTSWSIKLLMKYFDSIWAGNGFKVRGKFIHTPTLLAKLKDFNNPLSEEEKRDILECDLIVWDDIASTGLSQYDYSQLLLYIDQRVLSCKANIFTSNATNEQDFEKTLGIKLTSRILNTSEKIIFNGRDRRGQQ